MKTKLFLLIGILAISATANAGTLITPTLWAQAPVYFACNLTNVSDRTRTATTRIINGTDGSEMVKRTAKRVPWITMNTTLKGLPAPGGPIYCEFTVKGSKDNYRGG